MRLMKKDINEYIANGGDLRFLSGDQISEVPQEIINQYVANGGNMIGLLRKQKSAIPQKIVNQRVANGGDLNGLLDDQILAIPQEIINQYVANGGGLYYLSDDQKLAIPQEIINQYIANGGDLSLLSPQQKSEIPQEIVNEYAANGGDLMSRDLSYEQREKIPNKIINPSDKAKEALILYTIGKLDNQDLPLDIFVNYRIRKALLEVIKKRTKMIFNEICEEHGFIEHIPSEIISAFTERLQDINKEVMERTKQGIKECSNTEKTIIDEIREMEW